MSEINIPEAETITIKTDDPASIAHAFERLAVHIDALHKDVGLLSFAIGTLVNAGDAGHLAQPNATREILSKVIEFFEKDAPLSAMQLSAGLDLPLGSPPPKGRERLKIVQDEKKAA
jgi:hypothetical protein